MKIKMMTDNGEVEIDASTVRQFYTPSSGNGTVIEILNTDCSISEIIVHHQFLQVCASLAQAWGKKTGFMD